MVNDARQPVSSAASERHRLASALFLEVADLAPEERTPFLDDRCGHDVDLRADVERLLRSDPEFLESPALGTSFSVEPAAPDADSTDDASLVGRTFRGYRITGVIASGGMGTVYEAEQSSPRRRVAIKVLRHGLMSTSALRRFQYEAEVLGRLHHPGIAEIYEAGTEQEGDDPAVPYFAMELIADAKPITQYADEHDLDTRRRLELFTGICEAVHHGHLRGVIHRDLKPANILVDAQGVPKVIDFGVARATDSDLAITTLQTDVGQLIGTLQYMSPEQCEGRAHDLDTRTDVYSLGVVLYELLCNRAPYDVSDRTVPEAIRIIREEPATRPSTINRTIRGDLETITLKALEKDKTRRYESTSELAADLRRFVNDEPITARPPSAAYQLRKFARRHKGLAGGLAAVFTVLVAASIVSASLYLQAERARSEVVKEHEEATRQAAIAEAVNRFLTMDLLAAVSPERQGRAVTMHEVLEAASENIEGKFAGEPLVEASIRGTLGLTYRKLGLPDLAELHSTESYRLRHEHLGDEHQATLWAMNELANLYKSQGRPDEAESLYVKTLETRERLLGQEHPDTLRSMTNLAILRGDVALLLKTLELKKRVLGEDHLDTLICMMSLADLYRRDRPREAETLFRHALEVGQRVLGEEHPNLLRSMTNLAMLYKSQGRYAEAQSVFRQTLEIKDRVLGEEHPDTLTCLEGLAIVHVNQGHYDKAEPLLVRSLEARERTGGEEHYRTIDTMHNLALNYWHQGRYDEAEPLARRTLELRRRVADDTAVANSLNLLSVVYWGQGRLAETEPLHLDTLEIRRRVSGDEHPATLICVNNLADLYRDLGRYDEAEPLFLETLAAQKRVRGDAHPDTLLTMSNLAELYSLQGRFDEGAALFEQALTGAHGTLGEAHDLTGQILGGYGRSLIGLGRFADAEVHLLEAHTIISDAVGPGHRFAIDQAASLVDLYDAWAKPEKAAEWRALLPADAVSDDGKPVTGNR